MSLSNAVLVVVSHDPMDVTTDVSLLKGVAKICPDKEPIYLPSFRDHVRWWDVFETLVQQRVEAVVVPEDFPFRRMANFMLSRQKIRRITYFLRNGVLSFTEQTVESGIVPVRFGGSSSIRLTADGVEEYVSIAMIREGRYSLPLGSYYYVLDQEPVSAREAQGAFSRMREILSAALPDTVFTVYDNTDSSGVRNGVMDALKTYRCSYDLMKLADLGWTKTESKRFELESAPASSE